MKVRGSGGGKGWFAQRVGSHGGLVHTEGAEGTEVWLACSWFERRVGSHGGHGVHGGWR